MIQSADRSQRPTSRLASERAFSGTVLDELARLRGRKLGACAACGRPVFAAQSFTRGKGRVVHVRCPITTSSRVDASRRR